MTIHTKGPWFTSTKPGSIGAIAYSGGFIAFPCSPRIVSDKRNEGECWLDMRSRTKPERDAVDAEEAANARLIAAAPCLLDALNGLIAVIKDGISDPEDIDLYQRALAVVAKATGAA